MRHHAFMLIISLSLLPRIGAAGAGCCDHCGCKEPCQKFCRLVKEEKKVEVICYGMKEQEFCVPGPSKRGCQHCEPVCTDCDGKGKDKDPDVDSKPRKFVWSDWIPGRAHIQTKTLLMKKTETKKIPSYKWVVEDLCEKCRQKKNEEKTDEKKDEKAKGAVTENLSPVAVADGPSVPAFPVEPVAAEKNRDETARR